MVDGIVDSKQMGVEVMVNAKLMTYKDRSYFVKAELYEADSMRQLRPAGQGSINGACNGKSPKANIDTATWVCWHVSPAAGTKYFVRATLYDKGPSERIVPATPEGGVFEDEFISEALNFADSEIFMVPSTEPADLIYAVPPFEPVDD